MPYMWNDPRNCRRAIRLAQRFYTRQRRLLGQRPLPQYKLSRINDPFCPYTVTKYIHNIFTGGLTMPARRQINRYSTKAWSNGHRHYSFIDLPYSYAKKVAMRFDAKLEPSPGFAEAKFETYDVIKTTNGWKVVESH